MIFEFKGMVPVVDPAAYVHPQATLVGHVTVGPKCYVGPGAVLRGDWGKVVLEAGCNVQEGCVLHMFPGATVLLEEGAHIGHGAMIHGARVGRDVLVGMNAVILDDAEIGAGSLVGALALVRAGTVCPDRSLLVGNPAQIKGEVSEEMLAHKREGTALYQALPADCHDHLREATPLSAVPVARVEDFPTYDTWQARRSSTHRS